MRFRLGMCFVVTPWPHTIISSSFHVNSERVDSSDGGIALMDINLQVNAHKAVSDASLARSESEKVDNHVGGVEEHAATSEDHQESAFEAINEAATGTSCFGDTSI